jgi:hypothetical protein
MVCLFLFARDPGPVNVSDELRPRCFCYGARTSGRDPGGETPGVNRFIGGVVFCH